jgi:hypothetical protein
MGKYLEAIAMVQELSPSNLRLFLDRFQDFYDAVIRQAQVNFMNGHRRTHVTVVLSVQDKETVVNRGWVNVTLNIEDIEKIKLLEGKTTCVVLSGGLQGGFFNDNIYLSFCSSWKPENKDEFEDSDFFVAGKKCTWFTSTYAEK